MDPNRPSAHVFPDINHLGRKVFEGQERYGYYNKRYLSLTVLLCWVEERKNLKIWGINNNHDIRQSIHEINPHYIKMKCFYLIKIFNSVSCLDGIFQRWSFIWSPRSSSLPNLLRLLAFRFPCIKELKITAHYTRILTYALTHAYININWYPFYNRYEYFKSSLYNFYKHYKLLRML